MVIYSHLATTMVPHRTQFLLLAALLIPTIVCAADFSSPVISVLDGGTIEEATISNMWEIAAIVELLEQKGLCTKQDLHDIITEFRHKNPRAQIPETAFPEPYLLTETENTIIADILELLNKHGLTSHQSKNLLERLGRIIEMGRQIARRTTQVFLRQFTSSRRVSFDSGAHHFRFTLLVQFLNSKPVIRDG